MNQYEPEIGQAVFGCDWGNYETPEYVGAFLEHILNEIARVYQHPAKMAPGLAFKIIKHKIIKHLDWNIHQREWDRADDPAIPGVDYRPYYWGECTCGFEEEDGGWHTAWESEHCHTETCFYNRYRNEKKAYCPLFGTPSKGNFGLRHEHMTEWAKANGLPGAPWGMAVYCDCGYDELYAQEYGKRRETHNHAPDCPIVLPNFEFGEVEIRWYKHPGRGQSCNVKWDERQWRVWFDECMKAIAQWEQLEGGIHG